MVRAGFYSRTLKMAIASLAVLAVLAAAAEGVNNGVSVADPVVDDRVLSGQASH